MGRELDRHLIPGCRDINDDDSRSGSDNSIVRL